EQIFPTPDDHAELRSPIANVIVANNVVPEELRDAREGVAQKSAANMSDMHPLRDSGGSEIDHDFSWRRNLFNPEPFVAKQLRYLFLNRFAVEVEGDEARAGDGGPLGDISDAEVSDDRLGYVAGMFTPFFP